MKRILLVLILALVLAIAAIVPAFATKKGQGEESTTGSVTKTEAGKADTGSSVLTSLEDANFAPYTVDDVDPEDVACTPKTIKKEADAKGVSLPGPEDSVQGHVVEEAGDEGIEEEAEGVVDPGQTQEEFLQEATAAQDLTKEQEKELADQIEKAKEQGEFPICVADAPQNSQVELGDILINDPGGELDGKVLKADEETKKSIEDKGLSKNSNRNAIDKALVPDAQAQSSCTKISLVKQSTGVDMNTSISVASAINKQMLQHFSNDWWCATVNEIVHGYAGGVPTPGNWPLYLTYNPPTSACGAYHEIGAWPYYPWTNTPWGTVMDYDWGSPCSGGSFSPGSILWSRAISHEIVEMTSNPYKYWYQTRPASYVGYSGNADYWYEFADPVNSAPADWTGAYQFQSNSDGRWWQVSNYVLWPWFNPGSSGPYEAYDKWVGNQQVPGPLTFAPGNGFTMFSSPAYPNCGDAGHNCATPTPVPNNEDADRVAEEVG